MMTVYLHYNQPMQSSAHVKFIQSLPSHVELFDLHYVIECQIVYVAMCLLGTVTSTCRVLECPSETAISS